MSDRWYALAAFSDSLFADAVDLCVDRATPDKEALFEADAFLVAADDPARVALPAHLMLLDTPLDHDELSSRLSCFGGRDLLSRSGHDIINLFSPLVEYTYLSTDTIVRRVERGVRMGQQLNLIGHLLQGDLRSGPPIAAEQFLHHLAQWARRMKVDLVVERVGDGDFPTLPERLADALIGEVLANTVAHGNGMVQVTVDPAPRTIVFRNRTLHRFPFTRLKAVLRRPYQKFGNTEGNGLGLFLISLIAHSGGILWDIALEKDVFSLSFSFGG